MKYIFDLFKSIITGLITGIIFAIPLGPAGIESIKRTLNYGFKNGMSVAIGAVGADALDLILINFGLFTIFDENKKFESLFFVICGFLILFFSIEDMFKKKKMKKLFYKKYEANPLLKGFLLAISNPLTHSVWLTVSGTIIHQMRDNGLIQYYLFILFLIIGMIIWFLMLNFFALKGKRKFVELDKGKGIEGFIDIVLIFAGVAFIVYGIYRITKFF